MQLYTVYFTCKLLYKFWVISPPIIRSTNNYIYSVWYWSTLTNPDSIAGEIKSRLRSGNACYHSVQNILSFRLLPKNLKIKIYIEL
jgi:hypothetical protein